jgi:anti-anti-sigma factor
MDRYTVMIPYVEPDGSHPDRIYEATIEVSAHSPTQAKMMATREFKHLTELSWAKGARNILQEEINVKASSGSGEPLSMEMSEIANGILVLTVTGALDSDTDRDFRKQLRDLSSSSVRRLIMDLTNLNYINSTSIGEIATSMGTFDLRMSGVQPGVLRVLKMVGLDKAIKCFSSVEQASASFS